MIQRYHAIILLSRSFIAAVRLQDNITTQQPYSLATHRPGLEPPQEWQQSWWKNKLLQLTGFYARKTQLTTGERSSARRLYG